MNSNLLWNPQFLTELARLFQRYEGREKGNPAVSLGDVWLLVHHRYLKGDCVDIGSPVFRQFVKWRVLDLSRRDRRAISRSGARRVEVEDEPKSAGRTPPDELIQDEDVAFINLVLRQFASVDQELIMAKIEKRPRELKELARQWGV